MRRLATVGFARFALLVGGWSAVAGALAPREPAGAQEGWRPYGPLEAGQEAWRRGEERRLGAIRQQIGWVDDMKWWAGLPTHYPRAPSREYLYAYPDPRGWRPPGDVFEPWPFVPGDIWGDPWRSAIRQPIGQLERQTGPNRWESRPVYREDLTREDGLWEELRRRESGREPPGGIAPGRVEPEPPMPLPSGPREF